MILFLLVGRSYKKLCVIPCCRLTRFIRQFAPDADSDTVDVDKIPEEWMGLDVGPKTVATFSAALAPCKTVVSTQLFCPSFR